MQTVMQMLHLLCNWLKSYCWFSTKWCFSAKKHKTFISYNMNVTQINTSLYLTYSCNHCFVYKELLKNTFVHCVLNYKKTEHSYLNKTCLYLKLCNTVSVLWCWSNLYTLITTRIRNQSREIADSPEHVNYFLSRSCF